MYKIALLVQTLACFIYLFIPSFPIRVKASFTYSVADIHIYLLLKSDIGELFVDHRNFWDFLDGFD